MSAYSAYGDQEISDSKQKIKENREKLNEIKSQTYEVDAKLSELNKLKSDAAAYITKLDAELTGVGAEIDKLQNQITDLEELIVQTEGELSDAQAEEEKQYASMKTRIKFMYEHSNENILDVLFGSETIADLLNRTEYIQNVSRYDRDKLDEFIALKEAIASKKEDLESEMDILEQTQAEVEDRKASLEKLQADKKKEVSAYNARIASAESELSSMQADMANIQAAIKAEENNIAAIEAEIRRQEEEARKAAEAAGKAFTPMSAGDVSFTWPCPGSGRITSYFGDRESPTEGASSNHKGIDVGAPTGTGIVAAAGGTVVIATYSASAGNYVMISHGGGVYSVYMHMSSIAVSKGQTVSRGSTIGAVGSTGYSTGPHLHFGIRINGSYVNPLNYTRP
ncbi:MAG: peptidoglycan DD-metalloendopeptidase family protein [Eubacteriales bacterium]|nr:peptidoglycan DD-metalloendopeptidase family protein [Eubacteriales bacterium]